MAASPEEKMESEESKGIEVPIRWEFPDDLPILHVAHVSIRHTQNDFMISFFQVMDPSGTTEEQGELLKSQGYISARCVFRISVSPGTMSEIAGVMQDSYQKYVAQFQENETNGERNV